MAHYGPPDNEWSYPDGVLAATQRAAVFGPDDDNTYAAVFADAGFTVPLPNPTTTDASGLLEFYVQDDGRYWIWVGPVRGGHGIEWNAGVAPGDPVLTVNGELPDGVGNVQLSAANVGAQPIATIDALGDIYVGTGPDATTRLPRGVDGTILSTNSTEPTGLEWIVGSGGDVNSVNGQVGVVVLDAGDVGADVAGAAAAAQAASQPIDADLTEIAGLSPANDDLLQQKAGVWTNRTPAQVKTDLAITAADVGAQPLDADLTTIAGLAPTNGDTMQYSSGAWANRTPSQARTALGLGTAAVTDTGVGAGNTILGNDARLTDARTPTAHATSHEDGGADEVTLAQSQITNLVTDLGNKQPLDGDLTTIAGLTPANSDTLQYTAGAWANRTPTQALTTLGGQPLDSDLTTIAALTPSNDDVIQRKAGSWANRTLAQLKTDLAIAESDVINLVSDLAGKQPLDSDLTSIAALTPTNDDVIQRKGGAWTNRSLAQLALDLGSVPAHQFPEPSTTGWFRTSSPGGSGVAISGGLLFLHPIWPAVACTLTRIAFEVTTQAIAAAGTDVFYYGVYAARYTTGGQAWDVPLMSGSYDMESEAPGVKIVDTSNLALSARLYWIAGGRFITGVVTTSGAMRGGAPDIRTAGLVQRTADPSTSNIFGSVTQAFPTVSLPSGALPTISSAVAISNENGPKFAIELST